MKEKNSNPVKRNIVFITERPKRYDELSPEEKAASDRRTAKYREEKRLARLADEQKSVIAPETEITKN